MKSTKTHTPEIYWSTCPESNRAFLCVAGIDNNIAEIFPVEHPEFLSAHDTACRIANACNSHAELLAELETDAHWIENLLCDINAGRPLRLGRISDGLTPRLAAIRATIARATGQA